MCFVCVSILFYSILGCVLPLQEVALRQSLSSLSVLRRVFHLSLSFAILVHATSCCPTMSSLQRRLGLPTDLTPSVCHSVLLIVDLFMCLCIYFMIDLRIVLHECVMIMCAAPIFLQLSLQEHEKVGY